MLAKQDRAEGDPALPVARSSNKLAREAPLRGRNPQLFLLVGEREPHQGFSELNVAMAKNWEPPP